MPKPIIDIDDPRLVKALAHPVRVRILGILERRTSTPREISEVLGVSLETVSYHVRALKDFGFITLERRKMVRGAVEHHYKAAARPRITAEAWANMPSIVKQAMTAANLGQLGSLVAQAASQDGFERPESHLSRRPLTLDEEGFAEASQLLSDTLDRLVEIEREAKRRTERSTHDRRPAVAVVMLFDEPVPVPAEASDAEHARPSRERSAT